LPDHIFINKDGCYRRCSAEHYPRLIISFSFADRTIYFHFLGKYDIL
jgi:hypothetical protein